jgi:hypothetical protein
MANQIITAEQLREALAYDSSSGVFVWKKFYRGIRCASVAGYTDKRGAVYIRVDGVRYCAHRLAWLYVTGARPQYEIDHIDGNPANNAFHNLRDVPHQTNQQNMRSAFSSNKSAALLGTSLHKASGLWRARITVGKEICLGYYKTPEAAHAAYITAKRGLHEGCAI